MSPFPNWSSTLRMAMIRNQTTQITQHEESPRASNAKKGSSSVGRAFIRLFHKSPSNAQMSASETSAASVLGLETPQEQPALRAGVRGRTPPKQHGSSPTASSEHLGETSYSNIEPSPTLLTESRFNSRETILSRIWGIIVTTSAYWSI